MDDPFPPTLVEDVARFFETEGTRPPGLDLYHDVFEVNTFFPLQRKREMAEMIRTARGIRPRIVMEIGADKGGGVYHWCKCLPTVERMIACEIRGTPYRESFAYNFSDVDFLWLECSSQDRFTRNIANGAGPIDVLFVDGDKSGMLTDFDVYVEFMSPGGIVFLHDVTDSPGPKDAWETLKDRGYHTRLIHDLGDTEEELEREAQGVPPRNAYEAWLRHWRGRSCGVGVVYLEGGKR